MQSVSHQSMDQSVTQPVTHTETHLREPQSLISEKVVPASLLVGLRLAADAAAVDGGPDGRIGGHSRTTPPASLS
jgi:hypothetical protein